jgi:hypothetical protein
VVKFGIMPRQFSYAATTTLLMHDGSDDRAPGAAITAALCEHWDHEDPCRWPHRTDTSRRGELLNVRTYFDAPPEEETEVRHLIQSALGSGKLIGQDGSVISWEVVSAEQAIG